MVVVRNEKDKALDGEKENTGALKWFLRPNNSKDVVVMAQYRRVVHGSSRMV